VYSVVDPAGSVRPRCPPSSPLPTGAPPGPGPPRRAPTDCRSAARAAPGTAATRGTGLPGRSRGGASGRGGRLAHGWGGGRCAVHRGRRGVRCRHSDSNCRRASARSRRSSLARRGGSGRWAPIWAAAEPSPPVARGAPVGLLAGAAGAGAAGPPRCACSSPAATDESGRPLRHVRMVDGPSARAGHRRVGDAGQPTTATTAEGGAASPDVPTRSRHYRL